MKPKTQFQHKAVTASLSLPPLSLSQRKWAIAHAVPHHALKAHGQQAVCLDCANTFPISTIKGKNVRCPHCGALLTYSDSLKHRIQEKGYFSILDTRDNLQVQRVIMLSAFYDRHYPAQYDFLEIAQIWTDTDNNRAVLALKRQLGRYIDTFCKDSGLELRYNPDNFLYSYLATSPLCPGYRVLPTLRRNGFTGRIPATDLQLYMDALLHQPQIETIAKAGRPQHAAFFAERPTLLDNAWPAYRITLRNKYVPTDLNTWLDYIRMLQTCNRDIRNAHYVCPENLKAEHDRYNTIVDRIHQRQQQQATREKAKRDRELFARLKSQFFGINFTDGLITVAVLNSVDEYCDEGEAMHHCVAAASYYTKPDSIVLSARINGERVETVELSLTTLKVLQSRGHCNQNTPYHDRIIQLVEDNATLFRRDTAKTA